MAGDSEKEIVLRMAETADNKSITGWSAILFGVVLVALGITGFAAVLLAGIFLLLVGAGLVSSARGDREVLATRIKRRAEANKTEISPANEETAEERFIDQGVWVDVGEATAAPESNPAGHPTGNPAGHPTGNPTGNPAGNPAVPSPGTASVASNPGARGITMDPGHEIATEPGVPVPEQENLKGVSISGDGNEPEDVEEGSDENAAPGKGLMITSEEFISMEAESRGVELSGKVGIGLSDRLGLEIGANVGFQFEEDGGVKVQGGIGVRKPDEKGVTLEIKGKDAKD